MFFKQQQKGTDRNTVLNEHEHTQAVDDKLAQIQVIQLMK